MKRLIVLLLITPVFSFGQSVMTLAQCEAMFIQNNQLLIAEQFNITAEKSAVIQAGIWELPYLSSELNLYNPDRNKLFDVGDEGQKTAAISQLIYLGGKKKNEIELAKNNVALAELQYEDLMRNLKLELRSAYYQLYFDQIRTSSIEGQINKLDTLLSIYSNQEAKGNVPLKDVVRLQSLIMQLQQELLSTKKQVISNQQTLKLLLNTSAEIIPSIEEPVLIQKLTQTLKFNEQTILENALAKNTEYRISQLLTDNREINLRWQKSLAIPDLTFGGSYDQRGGAFNNQINATIGIALPVRNRNKGNIKIAEAELNQYRYLSEYKKTELTSKVSQAIFDLNFMQKQYEKSITGFNNLYIVYDGVLQNFRKRNISILEFTDFMESYNQSILFMNELQKEYILSQEMINYLSNQEIFN